MRIARLAFFALPLALLLISGCSSSGSAPAKPVEEGTRHYPDGWSLLGCEEADGCTFRWNADTEILEVLTPNQKERVALQITPGSQT